ncbi:hypothetical protein Bca101_061124 [Brassica carinata]
MSKANRPQGNAKNSSMSDNSSACSFNIFIFRFVDRRTEETIARHASLIRISRSSIEDGVDGSRGLVCKNPNSDRFFSVSEHHIWQRNFHITSIIGTRFAGEIQVFNAFEASDIKINSPIVEVDAFKEFALHLTDGQDNDKEMSMPFTKRKDCLSGASDISSSTKKIKVIEELGTMVVGPSLYLRILFWSGLAANGRTYITPPASGVNRAAEQLADVRTERGKAQ